MKRTPRHIYLSVLECVRFVTTTVDDHSRAPSSCYVRQLTAYITSRHFRITTERLGAMVGRHHSSIVYACKTIADRMSVEQSVRQHYVDACQMMGVKPEPPKRNARHRLPEGVVIKPVNYTAAERAIVRGVRFDQVVAVSI